MAKNSKKRQSRWRWTLNGKVTKISRFMNVVCRSQLHFEVWLFHISPKIKSIRTSCSSFSISLQTLDVSRVKSSYLYICLLILLLLTRIKFNHVTQSNGSVVRFIFRWNYQVLKLKTYFYLIDLFDRRLWSKIDLSLTRVIALQIHFYSMVRTLLS